jgi:serine/threonine protein kinase
MPHDTTKIDSNASVSGSPVASQEPEPPPTDDWLRPSGMLAPPTSAPAVSQNGLWLQFSGTDPTASRLPLTLPLKPPEVPGYQILRELGRGGMGVVYLAQQEKLQRLVALKMILSGSHASPEDLVRFLGEAEAVAQLQHPHIVQVYEIGQQEGRPYFSLEFVPGGSLDKHLAGKPQPPREAAQFVATLAEAMQTAHGQGIVHRDLKPANILLQAKSASRNSTAPASPPEAADSVFRLADFSPKVTDFGLAKRLQIDSHQTKTGEILGTPSYMAPEQAAGRGREIGPASDQYALGTILYELLVGRPPFVGLMPMDTVFQVLSQEPLPPSRLQPRVPRDLETICLKCLQKEPSRRYPSMQALAEDLQRFLRDEPILARPTSRRERLWRWCRRNPAVAALSTVAVLLLVAGSLISTYFAVKAEERAAAAEREQQKTRESLAFARQALEETTSFAVQDLLARQTQLTEAHRQYLRRVLAAYDRFTQQVATDAASRQGQAEALRTVGNLRSKLGEWREADEAYRQAGELFSQLTQEAPHLPELQPCRAACLMERGLALRQLGRHPEALAALEQALALFQTLHDAEPKNPKRQLSLSGILANYSVQLGLAGDSAAAETALLRANTLLEVLGRADPENLELQRRRAVCQTGLATLRQGMGRLAEAKENMLQAHAQLQALATKHRDHPALRSDYVGCCVNLGNIHADLQESAAAEASFRRAIAEASSLVHEYPAIPAYRSDLINVRRNLGAVLEGQGRLEEASEQNRQALLLGEKLAADFPEVPEYQALLADCLHATRETRGNDPEANIRRSNAILEKLIKDHPGILAYRRSLAKLQGNYSHLLQSQQRWHEAETALRTCENLFAQLVQQAPTNVEYLLDLAGTRYNLAQMYSRRNRQAEAIQAYRQALADYEQLTTRLPKHPGHRQRVAACLTNLAVELLRTGQTKEAPDLLGRAYALQVPLVQEFPKTELYALEMAVNRFTLGGFRQQMEDTAGAEVAYREAYRLTAPYLEHSAFQPTCRIIVENCLERLVQFHLLGQGTPTDFQVALERQEKLIAEHPDISAYAIALGGTACNRANQLLRHDPAEALEMYALAARHLEKAARQTPSHPLAKRFLHVTLQGRARLLDQQGRHTEAATDFLAASAVAESKARLDLRLQAVRQLILAGDHARAVSEVKVLAQITALPAQGHYELARWSARAAALARKEISLAEEYRTLALTLLRKAKTGGYFRDQTRVEALKSDPDFAALANREDFRQLLRELAPPFITVSR